MVLGWRRAFCTSVPREGDSTSMASMDEIECEHVVDDVNSCSSTPKFGRRFGFFSSYSNPSTPPLRSQSVSSPSLRCRTTAAVPAPSSSVPVSPKLKCETKNSPRCFIRSSNPSSPRSSSPLSFLRSSLRLCTRRCGLCLQSLKRGQGMATFTAECSHCFHFPCIADHVKKQGSLACPVCSCLWKDMPLLSVDDVNQKHQFVEEEERIREKLATRFFTEDAVRKNESSKQQPLRSDLKVYNDDEPLASLTPKARFIPIPESDETCDEESIDEFQGFYVNGGNSNPVDDHARDVDVQLLPEAAIIATSRRYETYAIVLRVKAPPAPEKTQRRAPIDLVTVVDVSGKMTSEKLQIIKRAMRSIVSSLSSKDRLSIVAFSSYSKRLLPLRRMTTTGRRAARRIVDSMAVLAGSSNSRDAVKKAIKVLEDRREKNPVASIILLSEVVDQTPSISSTRYSHSRLDIPIHSLKLAVTEDHVFTKCIGDLFKVVVQDLKLQLGFISGSAPAAIAAVYSRTPQPIVLGSSAVQIGELSADEERELLVELKVPSSSLRSHQILSVRCCYRESTTQEIIYGRQQALLVPRPNTVRSSSPAFQRLRNLFITTRALAESKRLSDRNDLTGAYHMLLSARALMHQSNSAANEFMVGLEAEISDLQRRRKAQSPAQEAGRRERADVAAYTDEKGEPLTPTSAWRVADRLAKVAMLRKSVNRVSDLHGFEDARF